MTYLDPPGGHHGRPAVPSAEAAAALARCVSVEPAKFAAAHWGHTPLLSRAAELPDPAGFTDLLSPADADELLSRRGLRTPFLRVAKDGQVVPAARFTGGGGAGAEIGDQVLDERVLELYASGATLVLQGLHRIWPPLSTSPATWALALHQPLQVNAYLTPPGSQGFATHYDTHDVFVLQVDGAQALADPPAGAARPAGEAAVGRPRRRGRRHRAGRAALDVVLAPGDALYLPRGWLHSAQAQDASSLHLTVGIRALTRYALVEELLALAAEDQRLRASLPFGIDVADPDAIEPELTETVEALRDWLLRADPARGRRAAARSGPGRPPARRRSDRSPRPTRWPAWTPTPGSPCVPACAGSWCRTARTRWRCGCSTAPSPCPATCEPAARALLTGTVTRVGDLPGLPDDADRVTRPAAVREAVLVPAEPAARVGPG